MGKRDVSHDIDLPKPLAFYRDGQALDVDLEHDKFSITQLNDQHAFLHSTGQAPALRPGDIVEFGISHPCTCIDKWRLILGVREGRVVSAYKTYFG
jgi:D-serine dehydratase